MRASVPDPIPKQPSKVDIVRLEFTSKRLEMEQKYLRLQKLAENSEENGCMHEHKAQRTTEGYIKVKSENVNLYIANKNMWVQIKDTRIGCFFGTQRREREASQKKSNHSQRQEKEAQEKAVYWENEHSTTFEELTKCRKSRG